MHVSLEVRAFSDHKLVEYAWSLQNENEYYKMENIFCGTIEKVLGDDFK